MQYTDLPSSLPPVTIRNLAITTKLRLHPEFVRTPLPFARRNEVDLADDVFVQTHFRKKPPAPDDDGQDPDDSGNDERIENAKSNIFLVRHGAIGLFATQDEGNWLVRSIDLNPSQLLYGKERRRLRAGDLALSLGRLKCAVTPLLAEPLDARHIVPGLSDKGLPVASWSLVDSELLLPGIDIRSLHGLSHPLTGPAEGAKKNRIQLGDKKDDCWIRIKAAQWQVDGPDGMQTVEGIRVRLCLKGRVLVSESKEFGTMAKVADTPRLVALTERNIASVHEGVMARLEGTHLPIPTTWQADRAKGRKDGVTHAKAMALAARLTSIPLEDIRAMDEAIRQPSKSTLKRLNKNLPLEFDRLTPSPVASLFGPSAYANPSSRRPSSSEGLDPAIADVYGEASHS